MLILEDLDRDVVLAQPAESMQPPGGLPAYLAPVDVDQIGLLDANPVQARGRISETFGLRLAAAGPPPGAA